MNKDELTEKVDDKRIELILLLKEYVSENGEPVTEQFTKKYGIEPPEGNEIVKVLDLSDIKCRFSIPTDIAVCTDDEYPHNMIGYEYKVFLALFTEKGKDGESLKYFGHFLPGLKWDEFLAVEDYADAAELSLAELDYIFETLRLM